jgi:isoamylase
MLMRRPEVALALQHFSNFGPTVLEHGVQFAVYSRTATALRLLLYDHQDDRDPAEVIEFDRARERRGYVWCCVVQGIGHGQLYQLQADGPYDPQRGLWFNGRTRLIDPYAPALAGDFQPPQDGVLCPPKCVVIDDEFDWEDDRPPGYDLSESVIYELHVRGFTRSRSSHVQHPGTYLGLIEKIAYLKSLGVTAVEVMPIHEFPIRNCYGQLERRPNYWGYDPMAFFAPHRGYAESAEPGAQVTEFKTLVKALHRAGIEVILDVVFNHTCEGNEHGPVISFKGLENHTYYQLEAGGRYYKNFSGCGNTVNCNHPVVRQMIRDCLRHWVINYHVDGFRFDLASILCRGRDGGLYWHAPLVEELSEDPILADTKLIAEAWDAAGAYQVGSFGDARWSEWNGRYRDDVRRFWRGDAGLLGPLATRLAGSSDLYERSHRHPCCSVNVITTHDGFTLNDLVSYRHKHNEANGEHNGDGDNNNYSENYGVEGPTDRPDIEELRVRQVKNMLATLMLSQGVPMLLAGDECRRTQRGNNNAYRQDNEVSWFDWELTRTHRELVRFTRALIRFRRAQPTVRRRTFLTGQPHDDDPRPDVSWFSARGEGVHWHSHALLLTCLLTAPSASHDPTGAGRALLLLLNASPEHQEFVFPEVAKADDWRLFINTASRAPQDIYPDQNGPPLPRSGRQILPGRSLVCYVAAKRAGVVADA